MNRVEKTKVMKAIDKWYDSPKGDVGIKSEYIFEAIYEARRNDGFLTQEYNLYKKHRGMVGSALVATTDSRSEIERDSRNTFIDTLKI